MSLTLIETYALLGKVLAERPDLAEKELVQSSGCGLEGLWQEVESSNKLYIVSGYEVSGLCVNPKGKLWTRQTKTC